MEELNVIQTIVGLGPSSILGFIAYKLWVEYKEQVTYNRDQDKQNLEQNKNLLILLDKIYDRQTSGDNTTHDMIKEMKVEIVAKIAELSNHLQNSK